MTAAEFEIHMADFSELTQEEKKRFLSVATKSDFSDAQWATMVAAAE